MEYIPLPPNWRYASGSRREPVAGRSGSKRLGIGRPVMVRYLWVIGLTCRTGRREVSLFRQVHSAANNPGRIGRCQRLRKANQITMGNQAESTDKPDRDPRIPVLLVIAAAVVIGTWLWCLRQPAEQDLPPAYLAITNDTATLVSEPPGDLEQIPVLLAPLLVRKVPVNRADPELLMTIPGIGPQLAARIVDYREEHGRFTGAHDLLGVSGIGEKRARQFQDHLLFD